MSTESLPRNKILRDKLINNLLDRCNKSKIKNRTLGAWVKAWHYSAPFGGLFAIFVCRKIFATGALIGVTLAGIFAVYFNGCFLSLLEYKLTGDKTDNITNIFLEAFNFAPILVVTKPPKLGTITQSYLYNKSFM